MTILKVSINIVFALFLLGAHIKWVSSTKLSSNGGYSVVVAIDENYPSPDAESVAQQIANIRDIFYRFSLRLWKASRKTFFIQDLSVVIPNSWSDTQPSLNISVATWETYVGADIRISEKFVRPYIENPNPCGSPGQFIELPLSFFQSVETGSHGPPDAALVNQWARYRFGVWEEHGYPNHKQFPYFYKKPNGSSWEMTGCSDRPIQGEYLDSSGTTCEVTDDQVPPNSDCRLYPNSGNTASTSYMQFHWLESMKEFCDETNHNSESPNRQNYLCGHRSIWEVIVHTSDYRRVTGPLTNEYEPPTLTFKVVTPSPTSKFYILLDQGRTQVAPYVLHDLLSNITTFFTERLNPSTVAAIGTFPNQQIAFEAGNNYVSEIASWGTIAEDRNKFIEALAEAALTKHGPLIRDFGRAILEVVRSINSQRHPAGAVIFVVKSGVGENTFGQFNYEQEVIAALKESGVKLFAVELESDDPNAITRHNLENVAVKSGGMHAVISKSYYISTKLIPMIEKIEKILSQPIQRPKESTFITLFSGFVSPNSYIQIPILTDDLTSVEFHLTIEHSLQAPEIVLFPDTNPDEQNLMNPRNEWDEKEDKARRITYTFAATKHISANTTWTLLYRYTDDAERQHLVVNAYRTRLLEKRDEDDIEVLVSTSAANNIVDMSLFNGFGHVHSPLSIFAKVSKDRQPIRNLVVTARIQALDGNEDWSIRLEDDGNLTPDILKSDGVYSGDFIPAKDGTYRISVSVHNNFGGLGDEVEIISIPSLLRVDQTDMECTAQIKECRSVTLSRGFQRVVHFPHNIQIVNAMTYNLGRPYRITDFQVITASNYVVYFVFTAPKVLGVPKAAAQQFTIYFSARAKNLIGTVDGNGWSAAMIGETPGTTVSLRYPTMQEVTVYYAVEALAGNGTLRSGPSNIVGVKTVLVGNGTTDLPPFATRNLPTSVFTSVVPDQATVYQNPDGLIRMGLFL